MPIIVTRLSVSLRPPDFLRNRALEFSNFFGLPTKSVDLKDLRPFFFTIRSLEFANFHIKPSLWSQKT